MDAGNKNARKETNRALLVQPVFRAKISALGVLRTLARLAQTHFLPLDFAGITGYESGLAQSGAQGFIVIHESAGDAVTDRSSLTTSAATSNSDVDVELVQRLHQLQRLTQHNAGGFTTEVGVQRATVDGDSACTRLQEHAGGCSFATACTVISFHDSAFRYDYRANSLGC